MKFVNINFDSTSEDSSDLCKCELGLLINPDGETEMRCYCIVPITQQETQPASKFDLNNSQQV